MQPLEPEPARNPPSGFVVKDALRHKLSSGLPVHMELADGSVVRPCFVTYDLWDEVFRLNGHRRGAVDLESALQICWGGPVVAGPVAVREVFP
jgi:hypothetical protein